MRKFLPQNKDVKVFMGSQKFSSDLARKMMVRWCGLEWRPAGECRSECVCV